MSIVEVNTLSKWLETGLTERGSNVKVLFTTMSGESAAQHATLHNVLGKVIPESIYFDYQKQFADQSSPLSNTMCSQAQFQTQACALGLNNDDTLVIYDNYGNFCASRVWFMCKAMGFENVYLLNGGLPKWLDSGFATQAECQVNNGLGQFIAKPNKNYQFVGLEFIKSLISPVKSGQTCILDARGAKRFSGENPDPRPNVRSGHIPSSLNLHYAVLQDEWGAFLPSKQLKAIFNQLDLPLNNLVFTCGSGVTACILAQAANMLTDAPLLVYDGSWSEWGAIPQLPIATGFS